jgi:hypothetical protein
VITVTVEPDAIAFIQQHGGHLIVFQAKAIGCCGIGSALVPMLEVAQPRKPLEAYHTVAQDGITIHVDRALQGEAGSFRVQLTRLLGWRSVTLSTEGGT